MPSPPRSKPWPAPPDHRSGRRALYAVEHCRQGGRLHRLHGADDADLPGPGLPPEPLADREELVSLLPARPGGPGASTGTAREREGRRPLVDRHQAPTVELDVVAGHIDGDPPAGPKA